jgi:hypothetical protein
MGDVPIMLRDVAASDLYKIRARQERVNNRLCHVLEYEGRDRLWLDTTLGAALVARETMDPQNGSRMQRLELGCHREFAGGLWLPMSIRNIQFDYLARAQEKRSRVVSDATLEVLDLHVNDVDDSEFVATPRLGTVKLENGGALTQVTAGGLDHLDDLERWIRHNSPIGKPRREFSFSALLIGCALGTLTSIVLFRVRWREQASTLKPRARDDQDHVQTSE